MSHRIFRLCALLLCLMLLVSSPALADIDNTVLTGAANAVVYRLNDVDVAVRTMTVPFFATVNDDAWEMNMYIDYVELAWERVTAMRLSVSICGEQLLFADELQVSVGKTTYTFTPSYKADEYDMTYFEDYYVCLGNESLQLVTALAQGKGSCKLTLVGDTAITGTVTVPAREVKALLELYNQAGGMTQDLSAVDAKWPMTVGK